MEQPADPETALLAAFDGAVEDANKQGVRVVVDREEGFHQMPYPAVTQRWGIAMAVRSGTKSRHVTTQIRLQQKRARHAIFASILCKAGARKDTALYIIGKSTMGSCDATTHGASLYFDVIEYSPRSLRAVARAGHTDWLARKRLIARA